MKKRTQRHDVIREIVRGDQIRTQRELAEKLQTQGYDCTQATISRDITDMGLLKSQEGFYVLPGDMRMQRMVADLVEDIHTTLQLVVVTTAPGAASGVAGAIDSVGIPGALGSVAGDNTILLAAASPEDATRIMGTLNGLRRR